MLGLCDGLRLVSLYLGNAMLGLCDGLRLVSLYLGNGNAQPVLTYSQTTLA
jgi:hypothetical protein